MHTHRNIFNILLANKQPILYPSEIKSRKNNKFKNIDLKNSSTWIMPLTKLNNIAQNEAKKMKLGYNNNVVNMDSNSISSYLIAIVMLLHAKI